MNINIANTITIARVILALIVSVLLFIPGDNILVITCILTALVIWADGLDGYFARLLKQVSTSGAILDIACDRVVEMIYWITFAVLHWIPVWIPLLYIVRGTLVDAVRTQANIQGFSAFGEKTMMQSKLGKFLVSSNFSRFTYAATKAVAFCLIILAQISTLHTTILPQIAFCFVYISAAFCILRGLPVLIEGRRLFIN